MRPWVVDAIRGGLGLVVELVDVIREARASRRRGSARERLEEHGELRSSSARERAHEALRRRREGSP